VIELDDDLQSARVHVRQMETAQLFSRAHLSSVGGLSYVDLKWEKPKEIEARIRAASHTPYTKEILEAEFFLKTKKSLEAVSILEPLILKLGSYGRTVFFQAAVDARRWELIIKAANPPQSIDELISLVQAYDQTNKPQAGKEALALYGPTLQMPEAMGNELRKRLEIREIYNK
jgi:hypothetical protein